MCGVQSGGELTELSDVSGFNSQLDHSNSKAVLLTLAYNVSTVDKLLELGLNTPISTYAALTTCIGM